MSIRLSSKQREFVHCKCRFSGFIGGVRSGKSFAGTFKGIGISRKKCSAGAVIAPTYPMLRDVLIPLWQKLLPKRLFKKYSKTQHKLWLRNGSVILFRSAENPERLYGLTLYWFHIDEAATVERKVWDVMLSRIISTKGCGFLTTTPNGYNWVYKLVKSDEFSSVFAKTLDNPLIEPSEVERARRMLDKKFFRQQYEASFEAYLGQVYDEFSVENIVDFNPHVNWESFVACDFGWRHPTALLWAQRSPKGDIYVCDEVVESYMTPGNIANILRGDKVKLPSGMVFKAPFGIEMTKSIITGFEATQNRQESGGLAIIDMLRNMGIERIKVIGGSIVRGVFLLRSKILDAHGIRHIFIHPRCKRLIDDFRGYHYPENASGAASELPKKDGIHDHTMDAIRYMVMELEKSSGKWMV